MHDFQLYGFSIFETMLARKGTIPLLERHWQRLIASAAYFGMQPPSLATFRSCAIAAHDSSLDQVIRASLMRCGGRWQTNVVPHDKLTVLVKDISGNPPAAMQLTFARQRLPCHDPLRQHKTGNRIVYQASWEQARAAGFDDCLFVDQNGHLLETTYCNVLFYLDEAWVTPPIHDGLLPGIQRALLLEQGLVAEQSVSQEQLADVGAMAVMNSVWGVVPVAKLDRYTFSPQLVAETF